MTEVWKDIKGYEGYYQISNLGRVKSLYRMITRRSRPVNQYERIMKGCLQGKGYVGVTLSNGIAKKTHKVHRLVCKAFICDQDSSVQVNHIDGNKLNNRLDNLEWVSNMENSCHRWLSRKKSSQYIGVTYFGRTNQWQAQIKIGRQYKYLGMFNTEIEAHQARVNYELNNNIINKYNGKNEISI